MNPTKTQVMWFGSAQQLAKVNVSVLVASSHIKASEMARNLGVVIDSQLTLSAQMAAYVAVATTSYGSCNRSSDPCHLMP